MTFLNTPIQEGLNRMAHLNFVLIASASFSLN